MIYNRLYIYPIGAGILSIVCILTIFAVSTSDGVVYSNFPGLTDLLPIQRLSASFRPFTAANYVFQWFLLVFSILLAVMVYIKYREHRFIFDTIIEALPTTYKMIIASTAIGYTMSICLMILPYCIDYYVSHYLGLVISILISAYQYTDVHISIMMYQDYQDLNSFKPFACIIIKGIVMAIGIVSIIIGCIFWELAIRNFAPGVEGSNFVLWKPFDWGYSAHVTSASCEWIFAITTFFYFCVLLTIDLIWVKASEPSLELSYIEYYY